MMCDTAFIHIIDTGTNPVPVGGVGVKHAYPNGCTIKKSEGGAWRFAGLFCLPGGNKSYFPKINRRPI